MKYAVNKPQGSTGRALPATSLLALALCGALLAGTGCERKVADDADVAQEAPSAPVQAINAAAAEAFASAYWQGGQSQVIDAEAAAQALSRAVVQLLESPNEDHLETAKLAWLDAHRELAGALTFIKLAFAPANLQQQGSELQLALDSWPAQAGYLDTVPGYSASGIVNDTAIELTLANLRKQHRLTAHEEASTGFHALEVMLWGPTSERAAEQFVTATGGEQPEQQASNRRRELTRLIAQGISEDMSRLAARLPLAANDLSQPFMALSPAARLQRIRMIHVDILRNEVLPRMPESSESDVESGLAADSKQALLAILRSLQVSWLPEGGGGLADLLLDRHQTAALAQTFAQLEERLLKMEDPMELAAPAELQRSRHQVEALLGLMSGDTQVPAREEDMTPVSMPLSAE
ncbi:imelysin family protein [Microbulbifer bruguierae]|uniref:Imelysin family protein n=1 Tax=Microbulbifer bruguierae TaxID=3029061 RepID=A0ABY8NBX5_9GAMM|nr:imelysin family protein [Microbulbifer bruguierae]WGL15950.1 imelysin family protein [Microbulbifer bruguierae]